MTNTAREPDPDCRICDGTGWEEVPGEGWAPENVPCACTTPKSKNRKSHFSSLSHIIDDCLAAGVTVYCVKMPKKHRDYLLRNLAKVRRRPVLPGREGWISGVPVIEDNSLRQPFIVITDER
jgi:rubredoxin